MIVYHKNNEIDRVQWDNCVRNTQGAKPYAYSWYLDIMAPGWEALVDDDYDSVFPVPGFRRFGFQYVATPPFLQQLGAYSPDKPSSETIVEFLEFMPDFYKHIDLCVGQNIQHNGYRVTEMTNYELDLSKPYDKLWENFSPQCKKIIENCAKKKPELVTDITPDEIIDQIILASIKKIRGIRIHDYQRLKILMNFCLKNKKGILTGVRSSKKRLIFGVFIIETHGNKTLAFMLNTPESITKRIGYFVINELIRTYSSSRAILDFAGASIAFNDSVNDLFGCENVPYYRIYRNTLFWPVRKIRWNNLS
jgi:hypothetical protein